MSDTFPDETLYPVLPALADEDRIFASNSAAGHESSQIKGSTIKGLINALKGTPPETLDTLAKLASAINDDPAFHTTLADALDLKQDKSNAVTTDGTQSITGLKTFKVPFINQPTSTANYSAFSIGAGTELWWYLQFKPSTKELNWFTTKGGLYPIPLSLVYDPEPRAVFPVSPTVPTVTSSDNSTLAASTAFVQAQKADTALTGTPTAPTAAPGTNTTQIANCAFVTGALAGASGVPAGVICMWSGTIATVPTGWALCDGANGTPDLVDRFVVAAGSTAGGDKYDPGDTGGLDSVTLDLTQIPAHTHAGTTGGGGAHTHIVSVPFWGGTAGGVTMIDKRDAANFNNAYAEPASVDPAPDHTHGFTTDSKGGGSSHENRPPYYALAYIMKL